MASRQPDSFYADIPAAVIFLLFMRRDSKFRPVMHGHCFALGLFEN